MPEAIGSIIDWVGDLPYAGPESAPYLGTFMYRDLLGIG